VVYLVGFGAWALAALACVAFMALICRGGQLEDQLVAVAADPGPQAREGVRYPLPPAAMAWGFGPRSALDDVIRTAEQAEL
jgi:hypothetical protein